MRIAMIGSGYVGLVSGACLSDFGHQVSCIDTDLAKIESLKQGLVPIFEPGLDVLIRTNMAQGRLTFGTEVGNAVREADVVFIAVGTPSRRGDGHADLSYVFNAAEQVATHLDGFTVVVTKSTVPVGTGDEIERIIRRTNSGADIAVVSNPEFLREGAAIEDFKRPDRIVVGVNDPRAEAIMREVYRPLFLNETPILFTNRRTSELTKYAANAFLAMKITFINEVADLCERVGADVQDVSRGIGLDRRIAPKFLHAGPGYGGSCFPKDTLALLRTATEAGADLSLVDATIKSNDRRKLAMAGKIMRAVGDLRGKTLAVLGLTFKPQTDDMRDAPSLTILPALQEAGATIRAYDPEGMAEAAKRFEGIELTRGPYDAADGADALIIMTEWEQFRALDMDRILSLLLSPTVVDLRNIYDMREMRARGFQYTGIGR